MPPLDARRGRADGPEWRGRQARDVGGDAVDSGLGSAALVNDSLGSGVSVTTS